MKIHKQMNNLEIAELLHDVAAAYKIKNEAKNRFRIIAYERAGDAVEHLSSEAKDLWDESEGELEKVAGIGESIATHLSEIFKTGKSKHFESIFKDINPAVFEFLKVPGIGPKNAYKLSEAFKIKSSKNAINKLQKLAKKGKIRNLEHFGEDSEKSILQSIKEFKNKSDVRMLLSRAEVIASEIILWLKENKFVKNADVLGSLRRKASTVGDIDIAVATNEPEEVLNHFTKYPNKSRILEKGPHTASIIIPGNIQVDLMVQEPESYGSLLQHFTGSKHHNIALREIALKKGLSLSEYGIKKNKKLVKTPTEEKFYKFLGMKYIPPELREDMGEIEAARQNKLPRLVELKDVKADLQIHSNFDIETSHDVGDNSMEEIIKKANELNYEYLAFTEHNPSQKGHNGKQIISILKRKKDKIDQLNTDMKSNKHNGVKKVFNSLEIDILPNGDLPISDDALGYLDFALVSIHSSFRLSKQRMTDRVLKALNHKTVKIFAHPTGRKLNEREGVELNWPKIFEFCLKNNKLIEINAEPSRLDLPDFLVKEAIDRGLKLTLGTDAHNVEGMNNMRYGVSVARRGWAKKGDIVNTRSLFEFEKLLNK